MDPNETMAVMIQHLADGNVEDAETHFGYLRDWIKRGGFRPTDNRAELLDALRMTERWYVGHGSRGYYPYASVRNAIDNATPITEGA